MAKESTNHTPYNYEFRRMLKKKYHLKTMDEANALANEIYRREMEQKTKDAIERQQKTGEVNPMIDNSVNAATSLLPKSKTGKGNSIFDRAEIVDIQIDEDVAPEEADKIKADVTKQVEGKR